MSKHVKASELYKALEHLNFLYLYRLINLFLYHTSFQFHTAGKSKPFFMGEYRRDHPRGERNSLRFDRLSYMQPENKRKIIRWNQNSRDIYLDI